MTNYFKIDRGIYDHPLFDQEPYSKRDAWAWMIGAACYEDTQIFIGGKKILLKRGQLSFSIRFLAAKWLWPKSVTARYLTRLKSETMIGTDDGTGQLVITICNYNKYQDVENNKGTESGTESGTAAGQQRDSSGTKKKTLKTYKQDKPLPLLPDEHRTEYDEKLDQFIEHRAAMKKKMTPPAIKLLKANLNRYHQQGHDVLAMLDEAMMRNWQTVYPPKEDQHPDAKYRVRL